MRARRLLFPGVMSSSTSAIIGNGATVQIQRHGHCLNINQALNLQLFCVFPKLGGETSA